MSGQSPDAVIYDINGNPLAVQNATAIPASTSGLLFLGSDGTNSRYVLLDTSGRLIVNQGAANTLANAWPYELTDGINGPVAVKPASTAAVATDSALVVAISPNNPISTSAAFAGITGSTIPTYAALMGGSSGINNASNTNLNNVQVDTLGQMSVVDYPSRLILEQLYITTLTQLDKITELTTIIFNDQNSSVYTQFRTAYDTFKVIPITLASLASAAARQSVFVDNSVNSYEDILIFLQVQSAAASTSTTGYVNIFVAGSVDGGATYAENASGKDAAITLTAPPNAKLIGTVNVVANSTIYYSGPISVASAFNGFLPQKFSIIISNQSGAALNATAGNHRLMYQGVYHQSNVVTI